VASGGENSGEKQVRPDVESDPEGWASASGLTIREAEELLDWLEANGFKQREVVYTPDSKLTVRWHR
jgi:hypothetical protein